MAVMVELLDCSETKEYRTESSRSGPWKNLLCSDVAPKPAIPLCKMSPVKVPFGFDGSLCVWCATSPRKKKPQTPFWLSLIMSQRQLQTSPKAVSENIPKHQEKNQTKGQLFEEVLRLKDERRQQSYGAHTVETLQTKLAHKLIGHHISNLLSLPL